MLELVLCPAAIALRLQSEVGEPRPLRRTPGACGGSRLYADCADAGITPVACTLLPVSPGLLIAEPAEADALNASIDSLNAWIRANGSAQGISVVDFHEVIRANPAAYLQADGIHPNEAGNDAMGRSIDLAIIRPTSSEARETGGHMDLNGSPLLTFAAFGIATQAVLVCFFAARRWRRGLADRFGWLTYAFAGLGLPLGVWLLLDGQSWRLWAGPLLTVAWALFGAVVDLWRPSEWRWPLKWRIAAPYFALYFFAQMFMWWPLWDTARPAWGVFLMLFVANTLLNLRGHTSP